jgi:L,D-transpeptidase catalytic domain
MENISRRSLIKLGATGLAVTAAGRAWAAPVSAGPSPALINRARSALAQHRTRLLHDDRIGIVDFSRPSSAPRFFIVDLHSGQSSARLVAHGRGSDPDHSGWAKQFSNVPGSFASSAGSYATGETYIGQHGRSLRLAGLDLANDNAESRAIVVHSAWYVSPEMARKTGMIGRSQGCFAVSSDSLDEVLMQLGQGRLLYADKA